MEYIYRDIKLILKKPVVEIFNEYGKKNSKNEIGGVLIGKIYPEYITIEKLTKPSKLDKSTKLSFIRSKKSAQRKINKNWKNSNGTLIYLGEWHTHPSINPIPSQQDIKMISESLKYTVMEIDFLFLIILGLNNFLWIGIQNQDGLKKMTKKD